MGQYFAICRSVLVRQCGSDNVEATLFILNITVVKLASVLNQPRREKIATVVYSQIFWEFI